MIEYCFKQCSSEEHRLWLARLALSTWYLLSSHLQFFRRILTQTQVPWACSACLHRDYSAGSLILLPAPKTLLPSLHSLQIHTCCHLHSQQRCLAQNSHRWVTPPPSFYSKWCPFTWLNDDYKVRRWSTNINHSPYFVVTSIIQKNVSDVWFRT